MNASSGEMRSVRPWRWRQRVRSDGENRCSSVAPPDLPVLVDFPEGEGDDPDESAEERHAHRHGAEQSDCICDVANGEIGRTASGYEEHVHLLVGVSDE